MRKTPLLFKAENQGSKNFLLKPELRDGTEWIFSTDCEVSQKVDGTPATVIGGKLYKRFEKKPNGNTPDGAIACSDVDQNTGKQMFWVPVLEVDKWFLEAAKKSTLEEGRTYELLGPKVNGNPEKLTDHVLEPHGIRKVTDLQLFPEDHVKTFESIRDYMAPLDIEGLIFKNTVTGDMFKIRKKDFRIPRK